MSNRTDSNKQNFTSTINFHNEVMVTVDKYRASNNFHINGKSMKLKFRMLMVEMSEIDSIDFYEHKIILN
jgi:hypothetical protein